MLVENLRGRSWQQYISDGFHLGEDEITHATVGLVLDSLDDIHCLTEAKQKEEDFLASILEDEQLHTLLNLYDQISTNSYRPFRFPPSDACERLKEGLSALNYLEVSEDEQLADLEEVREILSCPGVRALLQVLPIMIIVLVLVIMRDLLLSGFLMFSCGSGLSWMMVTIILLVIGVVNVM